MSQYSVLHVYFLCIYVTGSAKRALNTFYYILQCTTVTAKFILHTWTLIVRKVIQG